MNDTRKYILDVSLKLFLQKSFKEVTMNELVEKTGLSKGAFYHYFESKEQLFLEIVDYAFSSLVAIDYDRFSTESLYKFIHDYISNLSKIGGLFLNKISSSDETFDLNYYSLIFDAIRFFPAFKEKMIAFSAFELEVWNKMIHTARQNGEIKTSMSDENIANIFLHTNSGISMNNIVIGKAEATVEELTVLWESIYEEIKG